LGSEFPAPLQRPQPAQPRRQQVPRQAGELKQAQQLTRPLHRQHNRQWEPLHPAKDRRVPTPQQREDHTRVPPPRLAPQRSERVKQLPQPLTVKPVLHRQKNERRGRKKSRSRQRQVVAAKLKRNLKLSELHRKPPKVRAKERNRPDTARRSEARKASLARPQKAPKSKSSERFPSHFRFDTEFGAKHRSRSHDAVIRVYDGAGNVIETHEHKGELREW
jgi:hypothetical protein